MKKLKFPTGRPSQWGLTLINELREEVFGLRKQVKEMRDTILSVSLPGPDLSRGNPTLEILKGAMSGDVFPYEKESSLEVEEKLQMEE